MDSFSLMWIQKAGRHCIYNALDAVASYYTIPVAQESEPLTAITSPHGLYQYVGMPFRLTTAPLVNIQSILNPPGSI